MADVSKIYPWLVFGHEGGGSGGRHVERFEKSTSGSCLNTREVVASGRRIEKPDKSTSNSRLDAREVVVMADALKHHLWLVFGT